VLDPACGTAGFLISSYKHILKANTGKDGNCTLTPDERKLLAANFNGYDISPDMVRLSLVNMYLHDLTDPHISEYDTLTSQDRWNEHADVILANPPFMSPKGGIKPHNRFSVQSKRSEVLFVDYMAEHLTPSGRAGIIVPEGIIFQSQNAYTQLRKMLVEDYLVAVVSLPAGVFNPYSGVKTSILILDKALAKLTDRMAFFKIENDGFNLGAQRRAIDKDDLPKARIEIAEYLRRLRTRESVDDFQPTLGLVVPKEKIAANGDYNLSGERYRKGAARASVFRCVPLGELCDLIGGATPSKQNKTYWANGSVKWISSKHIDDRGRITNCELISKTAVEETSTRVVPKGSTIIITRVSVGKFAFADDNYAINQDLTALVSKDSERLMPEFIGVVAPHIAQVVERNAEGIGVRGVTRSFLSQIQIPLPPLGVQKEIVAEIEGYQTEIKRLENSISEEKGKIQATLDRIWGEDKVASTEE
jgi:type I restriction enzyme M protein